MVTVSTNTHTGWLVQGVGCKMVQDWWLISNRRWNTAHKSRLMCSDSICKDDFDWRDQSHWLTITRNIDWSVKKTTTKTKKVSGGGRQWEIDGKLGQQTPLSPSSYQAFPSPLFGMLAFTAGSGFFVSYLLPAGPRLLRVVRREELRGKRKADVNCLCGDRKQILRSTEGNHYTSHKHDEDT